MQHKVSEKRTPILADSFLETQNNVGGFLLYNMEDNWSGNVPHPLSIFEIPRRVNTVSELWTRETPDIRPLKSSFLMLDIPPPGSLRFLA